MTPEELRAQVAAELPDTPIVVALGGGADSAVAAWACTTHAAVRALFVDHGLEASPTLRSTAEKLADILGLALTVIAAPIDEGPNLEARARSARWAAIGDDLTDGERVVTGHSRDDLAETILMNLLRGAGSTGLAAMAAPRRDIIRPLLTFDRAELRALAERLALPFADDPANDRPDLLRNRIRARLIPQLEGEYRRGVRATLARSSLHLAADDAELDEVAGRIPIGEDAGALLLPVAVLTTVPGPVAARAVRRTLRRISPPYAGSSADVDAVLGVAAGERTRTLLGSAIHAAREGPYLAVWASEPLIPEPVTLENPGRVRFGEHGIDASAVGTGGPYPRSTVLLDPAVFPVTVRAAKTGERIEIDGGSKLIRDALAEVGVPVRRRSAWPVLVGDARIAATVAGRVAPWARPSGDEAVAVTRERT